MCSAATGSHLGWCPASDCDCKISTLRVQISGWSMGMRTIMRMGMKRMIKTQLSLHHPSLYTTPFIFSSHAIRDDSMKKNRLNPGMPRF